MSADSRQDRGFMMVALLISMGIVAIWMTAALPSWRQQTQRAKEEELIFRGEQYARAIVLFQNKNRNAYPADLDVLVNQHFLRKKWKDPVTGCDFVPVGIGVVSIAGQCPKFAPPAGAQAPLAAPTASPAGQQSQGITGVRSQSTQTSIKVYQQQQQHSLWPFDANVVRGRVNGGGANPGARPNPTPGRGGDPGAPPGRGGGPGGVGPGRGGGGPVGPGGPGAPPAPPRPAGRGGGGGD